MMRPRYARFAKFNLIGVLGTALQVLCVDGIVRHLRVAPEAATPIAVELALLHNFVWHQRLTWGDRGARGARDTAVRLLRFHAGNGLISMAGNTALTYVFIEKLGAAVLPSAVAAIALCAPANFLIADWWIFREPSRGGPAP